AGVGRDELWRARRLFEARWIRGLETAEGQATYLADWEAEGNWALGDRYLERLLTATPDQVTEAVRGHLSPDQCAVVIYRPERTPRVAGDAGAFRDLLAREVPAPIPVPPPRIAAVCGTPVSHAVLEREEARVRVYRTATGVPVLVRRKSGAPLVHLGVFALGGAIDEAPAVAGLTHLLGRTAIKGTERRTAVQVAEDAELLGGSIAAQIGAESFGWSISVPSAHCDAALDLLADVVEHAIFPDDALETERTIAIADLQALRDDMYRYPMRLVAQSAFAGHPYGVPVAGTEASLPAIDAALVRRWHRTHVLEAPVVIAVVGDIDPDSAAAAVARCFIALRMGESRLVDEPVWPHGTITAAETREKAQTALALAFPGPSRRDDDRFAAHLIARIASGLGGRFFDELRDRQSLAYTVQAFAVERRLAGMFAAYIATSPEKEDVAREGLFREFANLRDAPVADTELARAKEYAIGTYAIHQASGTAVLADIVSAWLFGRGLGELEEYESRIRAVTPAQMQALAGRYFDETRVVQGIVRGVEQMA
ncbi:MAG: insulinase family protein, partial [Gemmatimonadota bacterium]|nr:insulinase family protein [Gemmatimonadota bacterium]